MRYKVKQGNLFTIKLNCGNHKDVVDGVQIIVEDVPELHIGAHIKNNRVYFTELDSGTAILDVPNTENYLKVFINKIDDIQQALQTEYFIKRCERLKTLPDKAEYEMKRKKLCKLVKVEPAKLFRQQFLDLGYFNNNYCRINTNESVAELVEAEYGKKVIDLINWFTALQTD